MVTAFLFFLASAAQANTVENLTCPTQINHCPAIITQGWNFDANSFTLSNVSSATITANVSCQVPASTDPLDLDFTNDELFLYTPPNPAGPTYQGTGWMPEWIEAGLSTGEINYVYYGSMFYFLARQYYAPSLGRYTYNEYKTSGTPSYNTNYTFNIRFSTGDGNWYAYRNSTLLLKITTQQPPGSHQAMWAGAEDAERVDANFGLVSGLTDIQGGTTYHSWTGYVYVDPTVYTIAQDSTHLTYSTDYGCF